MNTRIIEDIYPLSPMQQGMLFHSLRAPESGEYYEQSSWTLSGELNSAAFQGAWQHVMDRHAALRTAFVWEELDEPMQVVCGQVELPVWQEDWRGIAAAVQEKRFDEFLKADRKRGFDLADAPLMRLALFQTADTAYQLVWSHHHLLLDGWSQSLVFGEVIAAYAALRQGQSPGLKPVHSYRDYIAWLQEQDIAKAEAYWRRKLKGCTEPTPLAMDQNRPTRETQLGPTGGEEDYAQAQASLSSPTTATLRAMARQHHLTLNTIVQGAWALVLSRYSGNQDVIFGATVSGRPPDLPGADATVGLFINTLPVHVRVQAESSVIAWLRELQAQQVESRQYEYSPLSKIQGWSDVPRDLPLFESIVVFENYPSDDSLTAEHAGLREIKSGYSFSRTNYALTVAVSPGTELGLVMAYDRRRFETGTINLMLGHLQTVLEGIAAEPVRAVSALPLMTEAERRQVLVAWNGPEVKTGWDGCVHELFAAQAERSPAATAVVLGSASISYAELNRRANQLAHYLATLGVGPESLVALCLEPGIDMVVAILGVLKAGGAYVPLGPEYPEPRLRFVLADTQVRLLLTETALLQRMPGLAQFADGAGHSIALDADWPTIGRQSSANLARHCSPQQLAYVIYTSGSTGRPKGTLLAHRGLANFAWAFSQALAVTPDSRILQFASLSFDAATGEIFTALLAGAALYIAPRQVRESVTAVHALLAEARITTVNLPPALLAALPLSGLAELATVVSVGDVCTPEIAQRWAAGRRFFNGYGPTETTIGACWAPLTPAQVSPGPVPIGRAIANLRLFVLDPHLQPLPVGVAGQLCIGGLGVARGYLRQPELTAEKFIPDPFSPVPGARLYQTGDLARFRPDGQLEFAGRIDQQVKLRGFRIELGEIEAVLCQQPAVQLAVVLLREDAPCDKRLVAYLVAQPGQSLDLAAVRQALKHQLAPYMLPAAYVVLPALPLLPSGKVDRLALPPPEGQPAGLVSRYEAPATPLEQGLAEIWTQVLGLSQVGRQDDFFDLGGHSLLVMQVMARVREVFAVELPLRTLFEHPTLNALAQQLQAQLQAAAGSPAPAILPQPATGPLPLSFAQQRLWFLDQLAPGSLLYHIPLAVRLQGALNLPALQASLDEIVRRHAVLRTRFPSLDGKPVQLIADAWQVPLPLLDLSALPLPEREAQALALVSHEAQRPFDLAHGPLLRAQLVRLAPDEHLALLTMHHIICDGWSMNVLVHELATLYQARLDGSPSPLPELPIQYADYTRWQRQWLQGPVLEQQLAYWRHDLAGHTPMLALPTDRPRPALPSWRGATLNFCLPPALSAQLKALSREAGTTLFMTLLAGFQALLARYSGQTDICVGTPIANRTHHELEGLIGFFVNTLVLRIDLAAAPSGRQLLARVREAALGAFAHQDLPFEMLVEALQPQRNLSQTPFFQVMFVMDQPPLRSLQLPGLNLRLVDVHSGAATFDLTLSVRDSAEGLAGYVEYNAELFDAATVQRLLDHWQVLLAGLAADPEQPLPLLPLLTTAESRQILQDFNPAPVDFADATCIHRLFEQQAARQPQAPALLFEGRSISYGELNAQANQLAHYLQAQGVGPEVLVAICTERGPAMIVGLLGVLKAGGAYLPLDPSYPEERLGFMLADARVRVLLTQAHLLQALAVLQGGAGPCLCLDRDWDQVAHAAVDNPLSPVGPDNLAYVIYTSGSTGKPKGTLLQHRGLCNLADAQGRLFGVGPGSRVLQFSPFSFDASVWETFMALRNGATLCLVRQEQLASGPELVRILAEQGVTNITLPPSVLALLAEAGLPELRTIIAAGEACPAELPARWGGGRAFYNAYGPTETTVCATLYRCQGQQTQPPIGAAIANAEVYVLDANLQPVPLGVAGELHVGGVGLARGYLGRPDLTAARFMPHPFSRRPGARLYKTGDLVRWRTDGQLEFMGRIDQQVKLRGFRIELGEIEAALAQHAGLRQVVLTVRDDAPGGRGLVAYVAPAEGAALEVGELRSFLRQQLPEYMLPAAFVVLPSLPLTPSGKVDRQALPAPDGLRPELARAYVAPQTELEQQLAGLCAELLGLDRVGLYDDFFDLGGHSLLATQLAAHIRDACHVELPLRTLFEHPVVADLAAAIQLAQAANATTQISTIVPVSRDAHRIKKSALGDSADGPRTRKHTEPA